MEWRSCKDDLLREGLGKNGVHLALTPCLPCQWSTPREVGRAGLVPSAAAASIKDIFSVVRISLKRILLITILSTLISSSMSPAASLPAERGSVQEASSAVVQVRLASPGGPGSQTPA